MMSSEKSNSTRDSQGALSCGEEKYTFSFLAMTSTARLLLTAGSWLPKELPAVNKTIFLSSWQGKDNNLSAVLQLQQICSPAGTGGAGALRRYLMFRFVQASFFFDSLRQWQFFWFIYPGRISQAVSRLCSISWMESLQHGQNETFLQCWNPKWLCKVCIFVSSTLDSFAAFLQSSHRNEQPSKFKFDHNLSLDLS